LDFQLFDGERHIEALERLSLRALADGSFVTAFRYIDRRCRLTPAPQAHHFTLRAEISYRMDEIEAALADLARAIEIAPDDIVANRRLLAWGDDVQRREAARRLLRCDNDFGSLAVAIAVLNEDEDEDHAFARVDHTDQLLCGWVAWRDDGPLDLVIAAEGEDDYFVTIPDDPSHPLTSCLGRAASFEIKRPRSSAPQEVSIAIAGRIFFRITLPANEHVAHKIMPRSPRGHSAVTANDRSMTVIVPIYDDFDATATCLASLMAELRRTPRARAVLVDDDTPDARIKDHLRTFAGDPSVRVLTNPRNLGFVGTVNRALQTIENGDVVLLNADTIVPPNALERLSHVANSAADIGTVTPLSNNGEFASFPVPNKINALGTYDEIAAIDAAAALANSGTVIDVPNGVGFCLYVTRACLDAVGSLSQHYHRGYLEDVDFCLLARERGFRNVCAPSIYVGHAGSRSFRAEKRSLVLRNLETLDARFPHYRAESATFAKIDPLSASRAEIERMLPHLISGATLLVVGPGATKQVVETWAGRLFEGGHLAVTVLCRNLPSGPRVELKGPGGRIPQSLRFDLRIDTERRVFAAYLARVRPGRAILADPVNTSPMLLELLFALGSPIDLLIADAGLVCRRGTLVRPDGVVCSGLDLGVCCQDCNLPSFDPEAQANATSAWRERWRSIAQRADRILVPNAAAKRFAARFLVDRPLTDIPYDQLTAPSAPERSAPRADAFGIVSLTHGSHEYHLIKRVAAAMRARFPAQPVIVIGQTIDDLTLMKMADVFVTGRIELEDYERVLRQYGINSLFVAVRQPLFGHPVFLFLIGSERPVSYFDWSPRHRHKKERNLTIDPRSSDEELIATLCIWQSAQVAAFHSPTSEALAP
jgi:GT2 family glycosyltransferase